jgi:hypothetical protein
MWLKLLEWARSVSAELAALAAANRSYRNLRLPIVGSRQTQERRVQLWVAGKAIFDLAASASSVTGGQIAAFRIFAFEFPSTARTAARRRHCPRKCALASAALAKVPLPIGGGTSQARKFRIAAKPF